MKKILITGFDPFNGESTNPSYEAVKRLPDQIGSCRIYKMELPTVFYDCFSVLKDIIDAEKPDVIINVGQAGGRSVITLEQVAINLAHARVSDNKGFQPLQKTLIPEGPDAYFTTLPIYSLVDHLNACNYPAAVSYSAGTFVCNDIMYELQHYLHQEHRSAKAGFIHVPYIHEQMKGKPSSTPSMALDTIVCALKEIIIWLERNSIS